MENPESKTVSAEGLEADDRKRAHCYPCGSTYFFFFNIYLVNRTVKEFKIFNSM